MEDEAPNLYSDGPEQSPRKKRTGLKIAGGATLAAWFGAMVITMLPIVVVLQLVLGNDFTKFALKGTCTADGVLSKVGVKEKNPICQLKDELDSKELDKLKDALDDDLRNLLDCNNVSEQARADGACIEGLMPTPEEESEAQSPVPARAEWLVPIWQEAGERYKVPWELLAAVNGARTNFGLYNCDVSGGRTGEVGFYRISRPTPLDDYAVNAGSAKTKKRGLCAKSEKPARIFKKEKQTEYGADAYDAVDATFTTAKMLSRRGAGRKTDWKYNGSKANGCGVPTVDGRVFYLPDLSGGTDGGGNGKFGYNKKLKIDEDLVRDAAKWTFKAGGRGTGRNMDDKVLRRLIAGAWEAFGVKGRKNAINAEKNYRQISRESGGRPNVLQGYIGDVNDNNPAGGLFQFIEGTFRHWKVDGFDNRFNPLDNILAAVNAQVNGPHYVLDGRSGWSPPFSKNPYATGGKARNSISGEASDGKAEKRPKFKGKGGTDSVSKAVAYQGAYEASDCYVASVNEWYEAIKKNPPGGDFGSNASGLRGKIVDIALREQKAGYKEEPLGSNAGPIVKRYNTTAGAPWCAWFASWVWQQAGVKTKKGKWPTMPAVASWAPFGSPFGLTKPVGGKYKPQPGDAIIFNGSQHIGIVYKTFRNGQILSIEGNSSDRVAMNGPYAPASRGVTNWIIPAKGLPKVGPSSGGGGPGKVNSGTQ